MQNKPVNNTSFPNSVWIGMPRTHRGDAAVMFRREFSLQSSITKASLHICGLGYFEAWINGQRVGDHQLDPAQTDYDNRCFYITHDVATHLQTGSNAIGVIIADGWYNQNKVWEDGKGFPYGQPRLIANLEVCMEDGSSFLFPTDTNWLCSVGPIRSANIYAGEVYDARLEQPGWDSPDFNDSSWENSIKMPCPGGELQLQTIPAIKEIETIKPISITHQSENSYLVDMGQNLSGWARITPTAPRGTQIRMTFAEAVNEKGKIDTASTGVFATDVEQEDTYICKGGGKEVWQPSFTYHGFRYVEVEGWYGELTNDDITAVVVHTALTPAGAFECSDARLNKLHEMVLWTHRSNIHGLPEDCPARERCGYLGDAHIICKYSMYNFDGLAFWEKFLDDIETSRQENDGLPFSIALGKRKGPASPDWMAAMILIPWELYLFSGKSNLLEKHFQGMKRVMDHFIELSEGWILEGGLGDWCDPLHSTFPTYTPEKITTTVWFYECSRIMGDVAELLNQNKLAEKYRKQSENIRKAFITKFYNPHTSSFGSQTADILALNFKLVNEDQIPLVVESLVKEIRDVRQMHHTVGIMGMRYIFEVLSRFGHGELALRLMHQNSYPSLGDLISRGATTLWEYWGEPEVDKADGPRSLNHPMMGGFDNWFYNTLGGINPVPQRPGFEHVILKPIPPAGLKWVKTRYNSPHGEIRSDWKIVNGIFEWAVTLPEGVTATASLPDSSNPITMGPGTHKLSCCLACCSDT